MRTQKFIAGIIIASLPGIMPGISFAQTLPPGVSNPSLPSDITPGVLQLDQTKGPYTPGQDVPLSDSSGVGFQTGDTLHWDHTNASWVSSPNPADDVTFGYSKVLFPDGQVGGFYSYNINALANNNGYPLIALNDLGNWVSALGGNLTYVQQYMHPPTSMNYKYSGEMWHVLSLSNIADECGAQLAFNNGTPTNPGDVDHMNVVDAGGKTATPTFKIIPTPPPQSSVSTDKTSYSIGDKVNLSMVTDVYSYDTDWHYEAIEVSGPNGYDHFLTPYEGGSPGGTATGTQFPYYGLSTNTLGKVWGGGSGDPSNAKVWNETATLDTSSLSPGNYTVSYVVYDADGRASTSGTNGVVAASFTLQPSGNTGSSGAGNGPALTMKFGKLPTSVPLYTSFAAPIEISNNSNKAVTTNLTLQLTGTIDQSYQTTQTYTYVDGNGQTQAGTRTVTQFHDLPITETVQSGSITIPAFGNYTWSVSNGLSYAISGGSPSSSSGSLDVFGPGNSSGIPDGTAKYYPILTVTAQDAADYTTPQIQAYVGTNYNSPTPPVPVLTQ